MSVYEVADKKSIAFLFEGWEETMIWSCLQDCMGKAFCDSLTSPKSAKIVIADFCFFAGEENEELVSHWPDNATLDLLIMTPSTEAWSKTIEKVWENAAVRRIRYAIKKEIDIFDREKLQSFADSVKTLKTSELPITLEIIDEELYHQIMGQSWSVDLCGQFRDYEDFQARGLGVAAQMEGEVLSGASSYTVYNEGIEIEIDTRKDWRRKGLALACGARLILECLDRGLYPSWDAHNPGSVALAEKLGYHFDHEYPVYEVSRTIQEMQNNTGNEMQDNADKIEQRLTGK